MEKKIETCKHEWMPYEWKLITSEHYSIATEKNKRGEQLVKVICKHCLKIKVL